MPLETPVNYLNDLVITNPAATDTRKEGDDHLRNIKVALKATFPGMTGRVFRTISTAIARAIALADNTAVIEVTADVALTPAAAATLGNGFMFFVKGRGGAATVNPDGAETINGQTTLVVPDGFIACVLCDGTRFSAICSPVTHTKGDIIVWTATGPQKLPVGDNDEVLTADSAETLGVKYAAPVTPEGIPSGSRMIFQQTSAPTGWTKVSTSTYNDAALRIVTGSVGTGGTAAFSTTFASRTPAGTVGGTSITEAQLPAHTHGAGSYTVPVQGGNADGSASPGFMISGGSTAITGSSGSTGSGDPHTHTFTGTAMDFAVKYADCIIATKD